MKPLSNDTGLLDRITKDRKRTTLMAISIVIGAVIVVALAVIALTLLHGNSAAQPIAATPTPAPTVTPTPAPTATPTPVPTSIPVGTAYSSSLPFVMQANYKGSTGQCMVGIQLANGAPPVDMNGSTIDVVCNGQTYSDVWTLKRFDWSSNANNNTLLEADETIATTLDTAKLGIPQGQPITINVMRQGAVMQTVSVAPL